MVFASLKNGIYIPIYYTKKERFSQGFPGYFFIYNVDKSSSSLFSDLEEMPKNRWPAEKRKGQL